MNLRLLGGHFQLARPDLIGQVLGVLAIDGAPDAHARAQNLPDRAAEVPRVTLLSHDTRNLDDVIHGEVSGVLHVLDLFEKRSEVAARM